MAGPSTAGKFRVLMWTGILSLSALIVANTLPYFSFGTNFSFLVEKGDLPANPWWRTCFYTHISGSVVCLATGPLLLWNGLLRKSKAIHGRLGRLYALAALGWAGPSGLYLSLFARGGLSGRACFLILGVLWLGTTALGILEIKARRITEHRRWMIRSYTLALSAVFFRVFYVTFFVAGMDDSSSYLLSLWLSLAASLIAGEVLARRVTPFAAPMPLKGAVS